MQLLPKCYAVIIGSLCVAIGVNLFLVPYRLLDGGMIGIGLLFKYYFYLKPGISIILVSIPLYILAFYYNRPLFYHSIFGFFVSSVLIDALSSLHTYLSIPIMLHSMYGGSLIGIGIGMMLAYGMNTGGTDLLAQMITLNSRTPVAIVIFIIDFIVLLAGVYILGVNRTLYSMIAIFFVAFFTHYFSKRKWFG